MLIDRINYSIVNIKHENNLWYVFVKDTDYSHEAFKSYDQAIAFCEYMSFTVEEVEEL